MNNELVRNACEEWLQTHIQTVERLPHDVEALVRFVNEQRAEGKTEGRAEVWREAAQLYKKWIRTWDMSTFKGVCEQKAKEEGGDFYHFKSKSPNQAVAMMVVIS